MIHFQKGREARQAHVGIPEGLYEEEHGRKGFAGRATQLYHLHPPTRWKWIEGPLQPRTPQSHQEAATERIKPHPSPIFNDNPWKRQQPDWGAQAGLELNY